MKSLLIVDDHFAIIEGYKCMLDDACYMIVSATSLTSAYNLITSGKAHFDAVILDMVMPVSEHLSLYCGTHLIPYIRLYCPHAKVIVATATIEALTLYDTAKTCAPDGIFVKSDLTAEILRHGIAEVLAGNIFYTTYARRIISKIAREEKTLDRVNRQIIQLLSMGIRTKDMPLRISMSLSAIEKRKGMIRDFFDIEKGNDSDIVTAAKDQGYI